MKNTIAQARGRVWQFLKLHPVSCALFFFLFITGAAAGLQIGLELDSVISIPAYMREYGAPFLRCALISVCVCTFILSMLVLSGLWLPAAMLWPIAILLRGAISGAAFRLAFSLLPQALGFWLSALMLAETAFMLPPLLKIAAISGGLLKLSFKRLKDGALIEPCLYAYISPCAALLPLIALQTVATPFVLYLFC